MSYPPGTKPFQYFFLHLLIREAQYSTYVIYETLSLKKERSWLSGLPEGAVTPIYGTHVFLHSLLLVTCEALSKMELVSLGIAFPRLLIALHFLTLFPTLLSQCYTG
jgi:hypothetical protein